MSSPRPSPRPSATRPPTRCTSTSGALTHCRPTCPPPTSSSRTSRSLPSRVWRVGSPRRTSSPRATSPPTPRRSPAGFASIGASWTAGRPTSTAALCIDRHGPGTRRPRAARYRDWRGSRGPDGGGGGDGIGGCETLEAEPVGTFSIRFLGCKVSQTDAQEVRERLVRDGHVERSPGDAAVAVVNTCCVTHEAVRKSRHALARAARTHERVYVTGCGANLAGDAFAGLPENVRVIRGPSEAAA